MFGFPNVSLSDVPAGDYSVQAYLNRYETLTRSYGSTISVRFPCGDGALPVDGPGSLMTDLVNVTVAAGPQTIKLTFNNVTAGEAFNGTEIGGCSQGNYEDSELLKHIKIRSKVLSDFWDRDMYVGANVLLPQGYNASDKGKRYPVIYHQNHWDAGNGAYGYSTNEAFASAWDTGVIPGVNGTADRETPKLIIVQFRHETPYYDDSYAVNTANIGPYGDAINDELLPIIEGTFNTIPQPYARIQDGGSTGGWESAANLIFRPDLFGACFSSYPDSLDFDRHQDIPLYTSQNAYTRPNGSKIVSIRENINGTLTDVTTVEQENHWELTFGTNSRSNLQWDVWNAVFGAQGFNGYPLEPWDKVTGEIYPEAVEYWKPMDLARYITTNWNTTRNLGEVLRRRIFIYVGTWDNYFLNEGVEEFQERVSAIGGQDWANVTILEGQPHGGVYQRRDIWDYLELVNSWVQDHAPDGETPLPESVTTPATRGNKWEEVIAHGGHQAALARQAPPVLTKKGRTAEATVGRWDPGVVLEAQWVVDGKPNGKPCKVVQGSHATYKVQSWSRPRSLQLSVTGRKRGYVDETRTSNSVSLRGN